MWGFLKIGGDRNVAIQNVSGNAQITVNYNNPEVIEQLEALTHQLLAIQQEKHLLPIFVVAATSNDILIPELDRQYYGERPDEWCPFTSGETIKNLLLEYQESSRLLLDIYFLYQPNLDNQFYRNIENHIAEKSILITNYQAIQNNNNRQLLRAFDNANEIGGLLVVHNFNDNNQQLPTIFERHHRRYHSFDTGKYYFCLDFYITRKEVLFRKLSDCAFAHLKLVIQYDKIKQNINNHLHTSEEQEKTLSKTNLISY